MMLLLILFLFPKIINLPNYGILKSYGIYEAVNSIQIILSNANGNSIEEYTGPGEYLSLYFNVSDVSVSNGQVSLPSGTIRSLNIRPYP